MHTLHSNMTIFTEETLKILLQEKNSRNVLCISKDTHTHSVNSIFPMPAHFPTNLSADGLLVLTVWGISFYIDVLR